MKDLEKYIHNSVSLRLVGLNADASYILRIWYGNHLIFVEVALPWQWGVPAAGRSASKNVHQQNLLSKERFCFLNHIPRANSGNAISCSQSQLIKFSTYSTLQTNPINQLTTLCYNICSTPFSKTSTQKLLKSLIDATKNLTC
jgi:hypothetical protein